MVSLFCPGECSHCNIWKYEKDEITKNEIDVELFSKALNSKYLANTNYFDLTAGESQLSNKYIDVVKAIIDNKPDAFIHTNISGWYPKKHLEVTKECLKYVKNKDKFRLDISFDGMKENYKKVRLVKNGYQKVLETLKLLKPLGIKLRLTMIVYKDNYKDIPKVVSFAREQGIGYFIGYYRSSDLLNNKNTNYSYTQNELANIEQLLNDVNWLTPKRKPNWLWAKSIYNDNIPIFNCYMGEKALVIDPYGDVFPCNECLDSLKMGNLNDFDGDIDALLDSKKALKVIENIKKNKCQPCSMLCAHKVDFPWGKQVGLQ